MAGHSPAPVVEAVTRRLAELGGASTMLPTEEAAAVGAELARRFGLPQWSFALTATDANRWAIRLLRAVTGRPRILVNSYCYHGTVDESLIVVGPRRAGAQPRRERRRALRRDLDQSGGGVQRPRGRGPRARPRRCRRRAEGEAMASLEDQLTSRDRGDHPEAGHRRALGKGPRPGRRAVGGSHQSRVADHAGTREGTVQCFAQGAPDVGGRRRAMVATQRSGNNPLTTVSVAVLSFG